MPDPVAFTLAAVVLTLPALASGVVERAPQSFPIIFLGLGFLIGERGFGLLTLTPEDPTLEAIAILTLALVLFLDAAFGISREYQALYGIGLVLLAYASAQSLGGDGFLAAFAAGFAVGGPGSTARTFSKSFWSPKPRGWTLPPPLSALGLPVPHVYA